MRNALLASAGLHLAAILVALVGLPVLFSPDDPSDTPISVEVVTAAELDQQKKRPPPEKSTPPPKPQIARPPPPPAAPKQARVPEPVPKPEAVPVKKTEPVPTPEKPRPAPPQKAAAVPPPPKSRPEPRPDEFQTLLKNLAEQAREQPEKDPEPRKMVAIEQPPPRPQVSEIDRRRQTATLAQLVKRQVAPCWNIPAGAKDAHRMRIGIKVFLNADGSLRGSPKLEDPDRMNRDPFYRALAESAIRALYNPRCSPLRLPPDQYELWQEISFNFDPREALEQ